MKHKAFLLSILLIALLLTACGKKPTGVRSPQQLGETMLNAIISNDFARISEVMTDEATYNDYREAMKQRFGQDLNPGFDAESYAGRVAETRTAFERIRTTRAEQFGINWDKTVVVGVTLSSSTTELENYTDYTGMEIYLQDGDSEYRLATYGVVMTSDGQYLLKPGRYRLMQRN